MQKESVPVAEITEEFFSIERIATSVVSVTLKFLRTAWFLLTGFFHYEELEESDNENEYMKPEAFTFITMVLITTALGLVTAKGENFEAAFHRHMQIQTSLSVILITGLPMALITLCFARLYPCTIFPKLARNLSLPKSTLYVFSIVPVFLLLSELAYLLISRFLPAVHDKFLSVFCIFVAFILVAAGGLTAAYGRVIEISELPRRSMTLPFFGSVTFMVLLAIIYFCWLAWSQTLYSKTKYGLFPQDMYLEVHLTKTSLSASKNGDIFSARGFITTTLGEDMFYIITEKDRIVFFFRDHVIGNMGVPLKYSSSKLSFFNKEPSCPVDRTHPLNFELDIPLDPSSPVVLKKDLWQNPGNFEARFLEPTMSSPSPINRNEGD